MVLGILLAYYLSIPLTQSLYTSISLLLLLGTVFFILNWRKTKSIWFGIIGFITMISIGVLTTNLHNEKLFSNHYSSIDSEAKTVTFRIRTTLKSGLYNDKYIADVLKIEDTPVSGKILLNILKDSTKTKLRVDDIYITSEGFQNINSTVNPDQFDYKSYLEKQYIYNQIYTKKERLLGISERKHTLFGYADALRETINTKLKLYNFKPNELAIINALILGQRQDITKAIQTDYTNAGAIHILAVSGLHVGIILLLLNLLFKPFHNRKYGKYIKIVSIVTLLWCFAIVAGLSSSVVRAVTMFSIVAIGMHLKRPTNIYNTLAISVFVLLLFRPLFIFDVGFQLSYVAVIAIVAIKPKFDNLWRPKYKIPRLFWDAFTVGIAAQLGVLPLSLFYFHQFPGLFFLANVIIIPFLGLILGLGIFIIVLALLNILPQELADIYGGIISLMNNLMHWVSQQEQFLFQEISFNTLQVVSVYILIIVMFQLLIKKTYKWMRLALISVLLFQSVSLYNKYSLNTSSFMVFHKSRHTVIGLKNNSELKIDTNLDSINQFKTLTNYKVSNAIETIYKDTLQPIYKVNNTSILLIDSLGVYNVKTFKPDYVILINSPKINLDRLIDSLQPKLIIADGSNYKSYAKRWKATCQKRKHPFHYTGEKGAFILEVE